MNVNNHKIGLNGNENGQAVNTGQVNTAQCG
jgi:hypothetical protein